jgi:hypothetical protein
MDCLEAILSKNTLGPFGVKGYVHDITFAFSNKFHKLMCCPMAMWK